MNGFDLSGTSLSVVSLTAGYGGRTVLRDLSFKLRPGLTVLLGENGSGKTTLFRVLSGALRPASGTVTSGGTDLISLSAKKRAKLISLVTGQGGALPGLTCWDLCEMALYPAHGTVFLPGERERERIRETARTLGAEDLLPRTPDRMSGGERQTARLLAALVQDTPVMLLDEPTAPLDYRRAREFLSVLREHCRGKTMLASLHDPALALRFADRILLLKDGGIAGEFSPTAAGAEEAEEKLRLLFPDIRVVKEPGGEDRGGFAVI